MAPDLVVVSTLENKAEIEEYAPEFAARYHLDSELILEILELLPVEFHPETSYVGHMAEARRFIAARDPDDVALAALALKLQVPIWSNDRDYEGFRFGLFTTAQLLKALGT
jgi:predicted nucleic acid-binding protein